MTYLHIRITAEAKETYCIMGPLIDAHTREDKLSSTSILTKTGSQTRFDGSIGAALICYRENGLYHAEDPTAVSSDQSDMLNLTPRQLGHS